jgi:hypothetical protein
MVRSLVGVVCLVVIGLVFTSHVNAGDRYRVTTYYAPAVVPVAAPVAVMPQAVLVRRPVLGGYRPAVVGTPVVAAPVYAEPVTTYYRGAPIPVVAPVVPVVPAYYYAPVVYPAVVRYR